MIFKDVYREVGILEVFVTCLQRYANLLKERQLATESGKGIYFYRNRNIFVIINRVKKYSTINFLVYEIILETIIVTVLNIVLLFLFIGATDMWLTCGSPLISCSTTAVHPINHKQGRCFC